MELCDIILIEYQFYDLNQMTILLGEFVMWTDREKILNSFDEINAYLESMCSFHDYRLGNLELKDNSVSITIEEDMKSIDNRNAYIWNFTFNLISDCRIDMDCILTSYISEVVFRDKHEVMISLTNGYIWIIADDIQLGIPQSMKVIK